MGAKSTRDGRRQSRLVKGDDNGLSVYTINHHKDGGELRLDVRGVDWTERRGSSRIEQNFIPQNFIHPTFPFSHQQVTIKYKPGGEDLVEAHGHEDYNHDKWFSAFAPQVI